MRTGRRQRWWLGAGGLLGFLVVLELVPRAGLVPDRYLPPASRIAGALADELGQPAFWAALGDTLEGWAIGLAMAVGAGVGLGLLLGSVPALRAASGTCTAPTPGSSRAGCSSAWPSPAPLPSSRTSC